jgi:hypothetical protein
MLLNDVCGIRHKAPTLLESVPRPLDSCVACLSVGWSGIRVLVPTGRTVQRRWLCCSKIAEAEAVVSAIVNSWRSTISAATTAKFPHVLLQPTLWWLQAGSCELICCHHGMSPSCAELAFC